MDFFKRDRSVLTRRVSLREFGKVVFLNLRQNGPSKIQTETDEAF
jgi:hypothetical protein